MIYTVLVWYAKKSLQNIILNENYIINISIVVTGAVFLRRWKKCRGRDMTGACYAG